MFNVLEDVYSADRPRKSRVWPRLVASFASEKDADRYVADHKHICPNLFVEEWETIPSSEDAA